jgi:hypothetical protein
VERQFDSSTTSTPSNPATNDPSNEGQSARVVCRWDEFVGSRLALQQSSHDSIQRVGKGLHVFWTQRFGSSRIDAGGTQLLHHIPTGKPLLDAHRIEHFASHTNGDPVFGDNSSRQGNVGGDDQVSGSHLIDNGLVRHVRAITDGNHAYQFGLGDSDGLISDQDRLDFESFSRSKQ